MLPHVRTEERGGHEDTEGEGEHVPEQTAGPSIGEQSSQNLRRGHLDRRREFRPWFGLRGETPGGNTPCDRGDREHHREGLERASQRLALLKDHAHRESEAQRALDPAASTRPERRPNPSGHQCGEPGLPGRAGHVSGGPVDRDRRVEKPDRHGSDEGRDHQRQERRRLDTGTDRGPPTQRSDPPRPPWGHQLQDRADEHRNRGHQSALDFAHAERQREQHELPFAGPGHHRPGDTVTDQEAQISALGCFRGTGHGDHCDPPSRSQPVGPIKYSPPDFRRITLRW